MRQSDIFTLVLIAGIGTLAAFFICNAIMGDPDLAQTKFTALSKTISSDLVKPDPEIFNSTAINPTIEVFVGNCEDIDQNGILDMGELAACGRVEAPIIEESTPREELERLRDSDSCITTTSSQTLCREEKVEYINKLLNGDTGGEQAPEGE